MRGNLDLLPATFKADLAEHFSNTDLSSLTTSCIISLENATAKADAAVPFSQEQCEWNECWSHWNQKLTAIALEMRNRGIVGLNIL
jgi:hypothetical protein